MNTTQTNNIEARVKKIIANSLDIKEESISGPLHLIRDLNGTSLGLVQMVIELETEFDISIPESIAEKLTNADQVIEYVRSQVAN